MSTTSTPTPVTDQASLPVPLGDDTVPALTVRDTELFPGSAGATGVAATAGIDRDRPGLRLAGQVAYPALVLALVIGTVLLGSYLASQVQDAPEAATPPVTVGPQPPAPPGAAAAVAALIDPSLVEVTASSPGMDGVRIEGTLTETAVDTPEALATHLEQVLLNNCVDNLHLVTPDNLSLDFWGHCFTAPAAGLIADTFDYALATGAETVSLQDYPGSGNYRRASYVWQNTDPAEYDRVEASWHDREMPAGLNAVNLTQYGAGELSGRMVYADLTREGLDVHRVPEQD